MKLKKYADFLNESKQEDKLLKAVSAFVKKEFKLMDADAEITSDYEDEEKGHEHITVHVRYKSSSESQYKGKSEKEIVKDLKLIANNYQKIFAYNFENFFETGWEGIKQIFSKKLRYNDILANASVLAIDYVSDDPNNYKAPGKYNVVRYSSDSDKVVIGEEKTVGDSYKKEMYIVDVYVTIFTTIF